ncbi:MAG: DUF2306 domain-containing protein [Hyphomonas sp.]|uniref:DUF2306 domain-containing protein n=1 Tax=Hyphomonas sp. TaxID=87 RepID=UPI0035291953
MTDFNAPSSRRFRLPSLRPDNRIVIAGALVGYAVLSWLILQSAGNPQVRFHIDASRFVDASFMIKLHVAGAIAAFAIGTVLLTGVKGRGLHRKLGYSWVAAMAVTAISSFFIIGLNGNSFSFIHGLSAWTVIALPMAVAAARRKDIKTHRRDMTGMFTGGLVVAGLFSFLPGRIMWSIFFAA